MGKPFCLSVRKSHCGEWGGNFASDKKTNQARNGLRGNVNFQVRMLCWNVAGSKASASERNEGNQISKNC